MSKYKDMYNTTGYTIATIALLCIEFVLHPYAMLCIYNWYLSSILNLGPVNMHHMLGLSMFCVFLRTQFIQKNEISENQFLSSLCSVLNTAWVLFVAFIFKGLWNV